MFYNASLYLQYIFFLVYQEVWAYVIESLWNFNTILILTIKNKFYIKNLNLVISLCRIKDKLITCLCRISISVIEKQQQQTRKNILNDVI
jgi:hypothetical protein